MDSSESAPRKRQRAGAHSCLACRRVKSKCEPKDDEGGACHRCSRLGVRCEYTGPSVPPGGRVRSGRAASATNSAGNTLTGNQHRTATAQGSKLGNSALALDPGLQDPALVLAQPSFLLHASAGGYDNLPLELLRKWTLGAAQAHDLAVLGASLTLAAKGGRTLHSVVGGDVALASVFLGGITSQLCNGAASAKAVGLPESAAAEAIGVARNGLAANTTPSPAGACVSPLAAATPSLPLLLAHRVEEADSSTFMHLERCVNGETAVFVCPNFENSVMSLENLSNEFSRKHLSASAMPFLHGEAVQDLARLLPRVWQQALNATPVLVDSAVAAVATTTPTPASTTSARTAEVPVEGSTECALNSETASDKRAAAATALALCQALSRPSEENIPQEASSYSPPVHSLLQMGSGSARSTNAVAAAAPGAGAGAEGPITTDHSLACRRASVEVGPWLVWSSPKAQGSASGIWLPCSGTLEVFLPASTGGVDDGAIIQSSSTGNVDDVSSFQVLWLRPTASHHPHHLRATTTAPLRMDRTTVPTTGTSSGAGNARSRGSGGSDGSSSGRLRGQRGAAKRALASPPRSNTGRSRCSSSISNNEEGSLTSSKDGARAAAAQDGDSNTMAAHEALASFLRACGSPSSAPQASVAHEPLHLHHQSTSSPPSSTQRLRRELLESSNSGASGAGGIISTGLCTGRHESRLTAPNYPPHQHDWTGYSSNNTSSNSSGWPLPPHIQGRTAKGCNSSDEFVSSSSNSSLFSFPASSDLSTSSLTSWSATASALKTTVAGATSLSSSLDCAPAHSRGYGSGSMDSSTSFTGRPDGGKASFDELLRTAEAAQALEEQQQRPVFAPCLESGRIARGFPDEGS